MGIENIQSAARAVVANLNGRQVAERHKRWLRRAAVAAMAVGLGGWIGLQLWPHWSWGRENAGRPTSPDVVLAPKAHSADATTSVLGTDSSAREGVVNLTLFATHPAKEGIDSTASIGADARNPQLYAVGSTLVNGMVLREIHADRVVLFKNSRSFALALNESVKVANAAAASAVDTVPSSRNDLSEILRPELVYENDRLTGLRILAGTRPDLLRLLGLEPGDIIRSVEGKQVVSDEIWQTIDDALSSGTPIVVGIERDGGLFVLSLDGSRLSQS